MNRFCILGVVSIFLTLGCQEDGENEFVASDKIWGEAGARAYAQGAREMESKNPAGVYISSRDREALRPDFGDLVDGVYVHWDSRPLDELASDEYGISVGGGDTEAQAYGYDLYFVGPESAWSDWDRLEALVHELTHTEQFEENGSTYEGFGYEYFREYYLGGQTYEGNRFEREAIDRSFSITQNVFDRWTASSPN